VLKGSFTLAWWSVPVREARRDCERSHEDFSSIPNSGSEVSAVAAGARRVVQIHRQMLKLMDEMEAMRRQEGVLRGKDGDGSSDLRR